MLALLLFLTLQLDSLMNPQLMDPNIEEEEASYLHFILNLPNRTFNSRLNKFNGLLRLLSL